VTGSSVHRLQHHHQAGRLDSIAATLEQLDAVGRLHQGRCPSRRPGTTVSHFAWTRLAASTLSRNSRRTLLPRSTMLAGEGGILVGLDRSQGPHLQPASFHRPRDLVLEFHRPVLQAAVFPSRKACSAAKFS
jgi:hypothetical protein